MANANYLRALERIKAENGGELPSDLYLQTNEELTKLLYDLTGKIAPVRTSKKILVGRIERATAASEEAKSTKKRKADDKDTAAAGENDAPDSTTTKKKSKSAASRPLKPPRGCLAELSAGQVAQMKRMLGSSAEHMSGYTHRELRPMWARLGMTAMYPHMTGKATVIERMTKFSEKNLAFHELQKQQ